MSRKLRVGGVAIAIAGATVWGCVNDVPSAREAVVGRLAPDAADASAAPTAAPTKAPTPTPTPSSASSVSVSTGGTGAVPGEFRLPDEVGEPQGLAIDKQGRFYVSDFRRIYRVDDQGHGTVIAGTGEQPDDSEGKPALETPMMPFDLQFDGQDRLVFTELGNFIPGNDASKQTRVRRIGTDGRVSTLMTLLDADYTGYVAAAKNGAVAVAYRHGDTKILEYRIAYLAPNATTPVVTSVPSSLSDFIGLGFTKDNTLLITRDNALLSRNADGTLKPIAESAIGSPYETEDWAHLPKRHLAIAANGDVYGLDDQVVRFDRKKWAVHVTMRGGLSTGSGLTFAPNGDLYWFDKSRQVRRCRAAALK